MENYRKQLLKTSVAFGFDILKYTNRQQVEAAFLDCVMSHFFTAEQCELIGRLPTSRTYMHLDAKYRQLCGQQDNNLLLAAIQALVFSQSCQTKRMITIACNKLAAYSDRCFDKDTGEETCSFLCTVVSILWYYMHIRNDGSGGDVEPI